MATTDYTPYACVHCGEELGKPHWPRCAALQRPNDIGHVEFEPAREALSISELLAQAEALDSFAQVVVHPGIADYGQVPAMRAATYAEASNLRIRALLFHMGLTKRGVR